MNLYELLQNDMKIAMKSGDALKLSVLRMLISAIRFEEINKKLKNIEEADVFQILQKQIKQHKDSIEQFEKGNRQDLVDKEKSELTILETYMPKQMTADELTVMVKEAIAETGAATKKDTGRVMKLVLEKAKGRTDGKSVNQAVMKILTCIIIVFFLLPAGISLAAGEPIKKDTFGQKMKDFVRKIFSYPANVLNDSVKIVTNTASQSAEVITKEVKTVGEVVTGDFNKTKEMIVEPLTGTAETVVKAVEDTVKIPVEAAKE